MSQVLHDFYSLSIGLTHRLRAFGRTWSRHRVFNRKPFPQIQLNERRCPPLVMKSQPFPQIQLTSTLARPLVAEQSPD